MVGFERVCSVLDLRSSELAKGTHVFSLCWATVWLLFTPINPFFITLCNTSFEREKKYETRTILSNGYLGSPNDEERSEMRYVMRIAEFSESSNL